MLNKNRNLESNVHHVCLVYVLPEFSLRKKEEEEKGTLGEMHARISQLYLEGE